MIQVDWNKSTLANVWVIQGLGWGSNGFESFAFKDFKAARRPRLHFSSTIGHLKVRALSRLSVHVMPPKPLTLSPKP